LIHGNHILVVEDEPRFCSHLRHLSHVWSLAMTIIQPPSTPETLAELPKDQFDILLVDFDLKVVNGLEVAEYFNLFIRRIPTMMISGSVQFDREQGDLPSYIDEFISKGKGAVHILRAALEMADRKRHPENYPYLRQEANRGW
jgi:CheY-like chemotaxis protein